MSMGCEVAGGGEFSSSFFVKIDAILEGTRKMHDHSEIRRNGTVHG